MSIIWSNLLLSVLLLLCCCCCCCWARPKCPCPARYNEATSREASAGEEVIPTDLLLSARAYYKPQRSYYATTQRFSGSPFLERVLSAPALGYQDLNRFDVPDAANYYSNDVPLMSSYELFDPEAMY